MKCALGSCTAALTPSDERVSLRVDPRKLSVAPQDLRKVILRGPSGALEALPAEIFLLVVKLLPAADLGRTEATSRALRAAVERVVRERAAEWPLWGG